MTFCSSASADVVLKYNINGSSGWVPYYIPYQPENPGILAELVPKILVLAQIENEKHTQPTHPARSA